MNKAFTLVEVAVAGSLIGFSVLTAVSIIPRGLQTINEARMRAVAAAAIMTLSAKNNGNSRLVDLEPFTIDPDQKNFGLEPQYLSTPRPPEGRYLATSVGALENRLLFTSVEGDNGATPVFQQTRVITAWLLNADPNSSPKPTKARYLATFTELK